VTSVLGVLCEQYIADTVVGTDTGEMVVQRKSTSFDFGLFFNTCLLYLKRCPLILFTANNGAGNIPVIKMADMCIHCIETSLEVCV
jgi:hypothetical protein